jgi:exopolysaccharide biosynthesis predicted pyruvyltransferase EpsI
MLVSLPQSLFYENEQKKIAEATIIKTKVAEGLRLARLGVSTLEPVDTSALDTKEGVKVAQAKVVLMWREKESYEEALRLYPFVSNMVVPDMAFQLGPYDPIRKHPNLQVDVVIFLRKDKESNLDSERHEASIRKKLPKGDMTFKIVDWPDRLTIFDTNDYFFTNSAIELLSLGRVVVCDRLHAAILSYLSGIPFVYIDQVSGKITKTLGAAFDGVDNCMDGGKSRWAKAEGLEEALMKASRMIHVH